MASSTSLKSSQVATRRGGRQKGAPNKGQDRRVLLRCLALEHAPHADSADAQGVRYGDRPVPLTGQPDDFRRLPPRCRVDSQVRQVTRAGWKKVFRETASGAKTDRGRVGKEE
jgi:hypothetical protein